MKRTPVPVVLVALALTSAVVFWRIGRSKQESPAPALSAPASSASPPPAAHAGGSSDTLPATPFAASLDKTLPAIHRETIQVGDEPWRAETHEEASWLNRNGYPTWNQTEAANHSKASLLPADGVARSSADIIMAELVALNDPASKDLALAVLKSAAESGSAYALQSLGRIAEIKGDPVMSESYYRAAILRGDWLMGMREPPRLTPEQNYVAELRAFHIIKQINIARSKRGLPPLSQDVRPDPSKALEKFLSARGLSQAGS